MATALHPQTQMTFKFADEILPRAYGFPMKIRVPTKLGFKNPKYVISMEVTNDYKGGYWEDQGYNSFSGSSALKRAAALRSAACPADEPPSSARRRGCPPRPPRIPCHF